MNKNAEERLTERLVAIESHLCKLGEIVTHQHQEIKLLKEIKKAMAITQADIDAVSQQVDDIKTAVTAQGVEIAKIGSDITAFLNQPNLTLDAVKAKLTEVGGLVTNAGQALQNVDDLVPEQPAT